MVVQRIGVMLVLIAVVALGVYSCKDMGDEVGGGDNGEHSELTASTFVVTLGPGEERMVIISGGAPPYSITEFPDPVFATAELRNTGVSPDTLVITAASVIHVGATETVEISESHDGPSEAIMHGITITIHVTPVPALVANPSSVIVDQSQPVSVIISKGTPPYVIDTPPNGTQATASFVDPGITPATLIITAISTTGSTSVKVKDGSPSPEREVTIPIIVIPVPALVANPPSVTVGQSQAVSVTISNGTPPYAIDTAPNGALATASFVNPNVTPATLTITGVSTASAAGSTSVKVKDSSPSSEREVTIPITKIP